MEMDGNGKKTFNTFYGQKKDFYYGLDVRPEFSDYISSKPLVDKLGLDLGCGEGRYAIFLALNGCQVIGVDRSRAGLDKLEQIASSESLPIRTRLMDVGNFTFTENSYDIIVAATILDHLDTGLRSRIVDGIKTSLKPGGVLYANVFTVEDPGYQIEKKADDISDTSVFMAHYFEHDELRSVFQGLDICYYYEGMEEDLTHGSPHAHGWACMLAKKPMDRT